MYIECEYLRDIIRGADDVIPLYTLSTVLSENSLVASSIIHLTGVSSQARRGIFAQVQVSRGIFNLTILPI